MSFLSAAFLKMLHYCVSYFVVQFGGFERSERFGGIGQGHRVMYL